LVDLRLILASLILLLAACGGQPAAGLGGVAGARNEVFDGHQLLTAEEAVDLARFRGWHYRDVGVVSGVPTAREVLVSRLPWSEARAFLKRVDPEGYNSAHFPGGSPGVADETEVFLVVVRGPVLSDRGKVVADSMGMVVDRQARVLYLRVGKPWSSETPPKAEAMPVRTGPKLQDVSLARAQNEIAGTPLGEPRKLPSGLTLTQININPSGTEVDPSMATFAYMSVTFVYSDTKRPRVWLSQTSFLQKPRVSGTSTSVTIGEAMGRRYVVDRDGRRLIAFEWLRGDRSLYLAAESGSDLAEDTVKAFGASVVVEGQRPPVPVAAPSP
jgi:hypothetical protein